MRLFRITAPLFIQLARDTAHSSKEKYACRADQEKDPSVFAVSRLIIGRGQYNPDSHHGYANDIACWSIDTNYNSESFFVRQAYFLGQKNPYESLKRALNAEIDKDAWESLNSRISRPFPLPETGRIAVKVINHLGDEVMKVFKI